MNREQRLEILRSIDWRDMPKAILQVETLDRQEAEQSVALGAQPAAVWQESLVQITVALEALDLTVEKYKPVGADAEALGLMRQGLLRLQQHYMIKLLNCSVEN